MPASESAASNPATEATTETVESAQRTGWAAVVTLALATLIVASEMTMAAFALPLVASEFGVSSRTTAWVLLGYSLPLAALAISAGRWVDRSDTRLVFMVSLVGIGVMSVLSALAPGFWSLMFVRVLQGLAAALYLAVYFPIVTEAVHESQRGRAMSYITTIMMLGSIAVAPIGGFIAESFGWREVFLVKMPLLAVVLLLGYRTLPKNRAPDDPSGMAVPDASILKETLLIGAAITAALLAFEQIETQPFVALGLMVLALAMSVWWARVPASRPVLALMRRRRFGLPVLALMLVASIMGLTVFSLPFFIAEEMSLGPSALGVAMLFFVGVASVISPLAGTLADRYGAMPVATLGAALTMVGMLTMLNVVAGTGIPGLSWRMAVIGIGMALFNAPVMTTILQATPSGQAGTAGGVSTIARTLGTTFGPAVAALTWSLGDGGTQGFRLGVMALAAFAGAGLLALLAAHYSR